MEPLYTRAEQDIIRGSAAGSSHPPPEVQWWRDALVDEWRLKRLFPSEVIILALYACGFNEKEVRWIARKTKDQVSNALTRARGRVRRQEETPPVPAEAREKWRKKAAWWQSKAHTNSTASSTPSVTTSPASAPDALSSG